MCCCHRGRARPRWFVLRRSRKIARLQLVPGSLNASEMMGMDTPARNEHQSQPGTGEISPALRAQLASAWKAVYRLLRYRPRTEAEIRRALRKRGFMDEVVEAVVAEAREIGWLNDEAFAQLWVESRARSRPRAKWVLAQELKEKGLAEDLIEQAVAQVDEQALFRAAVQKALRRYRHLSGEEQRRKVVAYLTRRGFGYQHIREWLDAWPPEGGEVLEDASEGESAFFDASSHTLDEEESAS